MVTLLKKGAKLTDAMQQRVRGMYTRLQTACNEDLQAPLSQGVWRALRDLMRSKPGLVLDYAAGMMASVLVNSPVRKQQALEMPTVAAVIVDRIATGSPHSQLACCTALGVLADTPAGAAAVAAAQPTSKPAPAALASLVVAATGAAAAAAGHGGDPARPDEAVADSLGRLLTVTLGTLSNLGRERILDADVVSSTPGPGGFGCFGALVVCVWGVRVSLLGS
ncbi:hypothetical protein MNEG_13044 [Monoraphidium neglectum]|uniref:Uncharacterized protein n=1 Tax=Monoraphidium neglectum TaxID=145388 RepID=A0A0D2LTE6_9CHLO|nr:hypothetical protein MNEG_13044 [Monoraphidium neglectum]KIY94919.1 hypothetical protein MNEG_13044 [Monoraphidium neglectum]|eukprot:XP_013893939.1 hypothetical protein MNEG_13044 [Monoraphidium neglectum]